MGGDRGRRRRKPFGFLPHYPGPGLGGDCIPVVPHFLAWRLREYGYSAQLIEAAHEINARMPLHVVQKIGDALNDAGLPIKGSRLLLLGVAYKANVHDTRESPSLEVMRQLLAPRRRRPLLRSVGARGRARRRAPRRRRLDGRARCAAADCVVVLTAAPRVRRAAALGAAPRSSWTRATSSRPGRTSTRI